MFSFTLIHTVRSQQIYSMSWDASDGVTEFDSDSIRIYDILTLTLSKRPNLHRVLAILSSTG